MLKMMGVYKILNKVNGKFYLGSSNDLIKREREHFWALRKGKHNNPYLQNAWDKQGEESFEFIIIENIKENKNLLEREQFYINQLKACDRNIGYNINELASGGGLSGEKNPNYGKKMLDEQKVKISLTLKGHTVTDETKIKMKLNRVPIKGERHYMFGQKLSDERKKRHSLMLKGRYSGEQNPFYGKKHNDETKTKMRLAKLGKTGRLCSNSIEIIQLSNTGIIIAKYESMQEAQRKTGVWASNIQKCCTGKAKTSGGYKWMFYDHYIKLNEKYEGV